MRTYTFETTIPEDRRLMLPEEIPVGRAEIHVMVDLTGRQDNAALLAFVDDMLAKQDSARSKEEIDQELEQERNSWE